MENCNIDVSGDYPAGMMPKLVETARRIADSGSCEGISCSCCPCSCCRGYRCDVGRNQSSGHGLVNNPAWFRAFVDRYEKKAPQGHYHNVPVACTINGAIYIPMGSWSFEITDRVCGTPRVGELQAEPGSFQRFSDEVQRQIAASIGVPEIVLKTRSASRGYLTQHWMGNSVKSSRSESITARRKRMLHVDI